MRCIAVLPTCSRPWLVAAALLLAAPPAGALPFGTIGGPADSLIRLEGGTHCSPPGTMCVEALEDLPLGQYALDGQAEIYAEGWVDHEFGELGGYVEFATQTGSGSDGRLIVHARDDFTLTGPIPGEAVEITARLYADGTIDFLGSASGRSALVEAKLSSHPSGWDEVNGGLAISTGTCGCLPTVASDVFFEVEAVDTFVVTEGVPFQLAYSLRMDGFTVFNGASSVIVDSLSTASLSFDLPEGYTISSELGYVPEPGRGALLLSGLGGLSCMVRSRRRRSAGRG